VRPIGDHSAQFQEGTLRLNELRQRQAREPFDLNECARVGATKARELQDFKEKTDELFRGVGTVIGVGIAIGVVGAAGYYSASRAPVPLYSPPASQPVPPPTLYAPSKPPLSATPDNVPVAGYFMTTCRYLGSPTVIRVQTGYPCPASVAQ